MVLSVLLLVFVKIRKDALHGRALKKITVKVLDKTGFPIQDAQVGITFRTYTDWNGSKRKSFYGNSDKDGLFSATYMSLDKTFIGVTKEGYYKSHYECKSEEVDKLVWQPWNPTIDLVLREKGKSIPLYAKYNPLVITNVNKTPVGFDLFVGDFVKPFGIGITNDLLFVLDKRRKTMYDYKWNLQIKTSGRNNGIVEVNSSDIIPESTLPIPNKSYIKGYSTNGVFCNYISNPSEYEKDLFSTSYSNDYFFMKVRNTSVNNATNSYYGKIVGLNFHPLKNGIRVKFSYYLNPTPNDRNLEFNVESNLFQNLKRSEEVRQP